MFSIVLQINSADLNSAQSSIAFKDGDLWRFHGRIPSFWTSSGSFHRILVLFKSGVNDVSMRTTPGVALRGGKPRRIYLSSLHLTTGTHHAEQNTCFILALYRAITSSAVSPKSQRLRVIFWRDSCRLNHRFDVCSRVTTFDIVTYPRHVSPVTSVQNLGMSKEPVSDACC